MRVNKARNGRPVRVRAGGWATSARAAAIKATWPWRTTTAASSVTPPWPRWRRCPRRAPSDTPGPRLGGDVGDLGEPTLDAQGRTAQQHLALRPLDRGPGLPAGNSHVEKPWRPPPLAGRGRRPGGPGARTRPATAGPCWRMDRWLTRLEVLPPARRSPAGHFMAKRRRFLAAVEATLPTAAAGLQHFPACRWSWRPWPTDRGRPICRPHTFTERGFIKNRSPSWHRAAWSN